MDGKNFCCVVDSVDSVDGNNNEKQRQDLKQRFENLAKYVHYMEKFLEETILSDTTISRVNVGQSNKLPQLVRCVRTEDCIAMQLSSNTVQVNFTENHLKIIIWQEEEGDMLATIIFTVGSETRAQTFSLMTDSSSQISAEMRGLLTDTRRRLRSVNQ